MPGLQAPRKVKSHCLTVFAWLFPFFDLAGEGSVRPGRRRWNVGISKSKLDRCKAIRRAHRGVTIDVTTKLTREIDEMSMLEPLTEEHRTRLNVQLETKSTVLA